MHDPLALRAWQELYPGKRPRKTLMMRYSGRFKDYNATVTDRPGTLARPGTITFSLSREFEGVSEEIKLGVMQHLLNRLKGTKVDTVEIQLYNRFIKKLADYLKQEVWAYAGSPGEYELELKYLADLLGLDPQR